MMKVSAPELGSYAGAGTAIGASMTMTEIGVLIGIVTALLTFALNLWYTRQKNAREQLLIDHQLRLTELEEQAARARLAALEVKP